MKQSDSIDKLAPSFCKFQAEVGDVIKNSNNPFYKSKYADLTQVLETVRKPLADNGLSIIQGNEQSDIPETINITTRLLHESGQYIDSGALTLHITKKDPQMAGSAVTYGRRYQLASLLGLIQADDDANTHVTQPNQQQPPKKTETKPPAPKPTGKQQQARSNGAYDKELYKTRIKEQLTELDALGKDLEEVLRYAQSTFGSKKQSFDDIFDEAESETYFMAFVSGADRVIAKLKAEKEGK